MKKTLLAAALALAFTGAAYAQSGAQTSDRGGENTSGENTASAARSAALNNGSTGTFDNAFNSTSSHITGYSELTGAVSGNTVYGVGNSPSNSGNANGGKQGGDAR